MGYRLTIPLVVGTCVACGHWLWPHAAWWPLVHALFPLGVFSVGAWCARRPLSWGIVVQGGATVLLVAAAFTYINANPELPSWGRVAMNYLVPVAVVQLGALKETRGSFVPPPNRRSP